MPISKIQDQLDNLSKQFDQHFKSKLLVMLDVLNNLADPNAKPNVSISNLSKSKPSLDKYSNDQYSKPKPIPKPIPQPLSKPKQDLNTARNREIPKKPAYELDKNLLEDDNDLLGDFSLNDKVKDNDLVDQTSEINFLNDIPDPTDNNIDPSLIKNTDKAFDVIQEVLENELEELDLSNRQLGDEFVKSMIESITDYSSGIPLCITRLNLSGNDITDEGA